MGTATTNGAISHAPHPSQVQHHPPQTQQTPSIPRIIPTPVTQTPVPRPPTAQRMTPVPAATAPPQRATPANQSAAAKPKVQLSVASGSNDNASSPAAAASTPTTSASGPSTQTVTSPQTPARRLSLSPVGQSLRRTTILSNTLISLLSILLKMIRRILLSSPLAPRQIQAQNLTLSWMATSSQARFHWMALART